MKALNTAVRQPSVATLLAVKRAHAPFDTKEPTPEIISASLECPTHRHRDAMARFWSEYDRLMDIVNQAVKEAGLTKRLIALYAAELGRRRETKSHG
jgi:hypothetical protein